MSGSWRRPGALVEVHCPRGGCLLAQVYRSRDGRLKVRAPDNRDTSREFRKGATGWGQAQDRPVKRRDYWYCRHGSNTLGREDIEREAARGAQEGRTAHIAAEIADRTQRQRD